MVLHQFVIFVPGGFRDIWGPGKHVTTYLMVLVNR